MHSDGLNRELVVEDEFRTRDVCVIVVDRNYER